MQQGVDVAIATANKGEAALRALRHARGARELCAVVWRRVKGACGVAVYQWRSRLQQVRAAGERAAVQAEAARRERALEAWPSE